MHHHFHGEVTESIGRTNRMLSGEEAASMIPGLQRGLDRFQISDLANIIETIRG